MSVSPYSVQHDYEVQEYNKRRAAYLAAEKKRKQDEKLQKQAALASLKESRSAGHAKGSRGGFLKKLLHGRGRVHRDKDGMSRLAGDDNDKDDADVETLVGETGLDGDGDSDNLSLKTVLGQG